MYMYINDQSTISSVSALVVEYAMIQCRHVLFYCVQMMLLLHKLLVGRLFT